MLKTKTTQFRFNVFATIIVKLFFVFTKNVNASLVKISNNEQITQTKFLKFKKLKFYKKFFESEHIS